MAVIELAVPGQEATTYELIVTVGNAALTLNGVIATQLLTPMNAVACDDDGDCPSDSVDVSSKDAFSDSNGPIRFTYYTILLTCISLSACAIFTSFLPASKEECKEWKEKGEAMGASATRGKLALLMSAIVVGVSFLWYFLIGIVVYTFISYIIVRTYCCNLAA
jgi:ABC-type multidrug transport system permease subunit